MKEIRKSEVKRKKYLFKLAITLVGFTILVHVLSYIFTSNILGKSIEKITKEPILYNGIIYKFPSYKVIDSEKKIELFIKASSYSADPLDCCKIDFYITQKILANLGTVISKYTDWQILYYNYYSDQEDITMEDDHVPPIHFTIQSLLHAGILREQYESVDDVEIIFTNKPDSESLTIQGNMRFDNPVGGE